jgi:hypothetical protein
VGGKSPAVKADSVTATWRKCGSLDLDISLPYGRLWPIIFVVIKVKTYGGCFEYRFDIKGKLKNENEI